MSIGNLGELSHIYAVISNRALVKSIDNGLNWTILRQGYQGGAAERCVVTNPFNPNIVYKGVEGNPVDGRGILKSENGGVSWVTKNNGLPLQTLSPRRLVIFPSQTNQMVLALVGAGTTLPDAPVYYSTDGGDLWQLPQTPPPPSTWIPDLALDPQPFHESWIYAAVSSALPEEAGVYCSADNGDIWERLPNQPNHYLFATCFAVSPNGILFCGESDLWAGKIERSTNNGQEWIVEHDFDNGRVRDIAVDPVYPNIVYAALAPSDWPNDVEPAGIWRSTDSGDNWYPFNNVLTDRFAYSLAFDPFNPSNLFAGTSTSFFYCACYETPYHWEERTKGMPPVLTRAVFPYLPRINVFSFHNHYLSENCSRDWRSVSKMNDGIYSNTASAIDPTTDQNIIVSWQTSTSDPKPRIIKSTDGGLIWQEKWREDVRPCDVEAIEYSPSESQIIYAGLIGMMGELLRFLKSTDAGETWREDIVQQPPITYVIGVAIHNNDPNIVYICDGSGIGANQGVYKSEQGGLNWQPFNDNLPVPDITFNTIAIDKTNTHLYVGSNQGIWRRRLEAGSVWEQINNGINENDVRAIVTNPAEPNIIYCATKDVDGIGHIYTSPNHGDIWIETGIAWPTFDGIPKPGIVYDLAIDPNAPDTVYAATGKGIFYYVDNYISGIITQNTTLGPGDYVVTGDITVPSGITLTIQPNTNLYFTPSFDRTGSGYNLYKCELIIQGTLNAVGYQADSIRFISLASSPQAGDWYGIRAVANSNVTISYARIQDAYAGVECKTNNFSVNYCTITRNEVYGMRFEYCNPVSITGNNFTANKVYGIFAFSCGLNLTGNYIEQTSGYAINLRGASSCTFYDDPIMITCNKITGLDWPDTYGVYCYGSGISAITDDVYSHTYIESFGQAGICCSKFASPTITNFYNIRTNFMGLYCTNSSNPTVRGDPGPAVRSWFQNNTYAIWAEGYSRPNLGEDPSSPGYNNIVGSLIYHVFYDDSPGVPLMAEMNWWGFDPPDPEKFLGNVDYDPWLHGPGGGGGQSGPISEIVRTIFYQGHPNPFNNRITFRYDLCRKGNVAIKLYNILGRLVKNLDLGGKEKGH